MTHHLLVSRKSETVDSLIEELGKKKKKNLRLPLLVKLSKLFCSSNPSQALSVGEEALAISMDLNDIPSIIESLKTVAKARFLLSDHEEALKYYNDAISYCDTVHNDVEKSIILRQMEKPLCANGRFLEALENFEKAIVIQEKNNCQEELMTTYGMLGNIYYKFGDYQQALEFFMKSVHIAKLLQHSEGEAMAMGVVSLIFSDLKEYDRALEIRLSHSAVYKENPVLESVNMENIAHLYFLKKEYELSIKYFNDALGLYKRLNDKTRLAVCCANIADAYRELGDLHQAMSYSHQAIEASASVESFHAKTASWWQHGKILNEMGQYKKALTFLLPLLPSLSQGTWQDVHGDILNEISIAYKNLADYMNALEYQKQAFEIKIDLLREQRKIDLQFIELQLEIERSKIETIQARQKVEQLEKSIAIRTREVTSLGLDAVRKNELLLSLKKQAHELSPYVQNQKYVRAFVKNIEEVINAEYAQKQFQEALEHLNGDFLSCLQKRFPLLTKTEQKICSMVKLGMKTPEIANLLFISQRTIEWHRMHIRKKFGLTDKKEISEFLNELTPPMLQS